MTHSPTVTEHKMTHGMTAWFNVWLPNFKMIDWQVKLSDQLILTGCVWLNIWMTDSLTNKQCVWVMEWRENQSINEPTSPKNTKKTYSFVSPLYWLHTSRVRPSKWFPWRKSNKKERGRNNLRNSKKKYACTWIITVTIEYSHVNHYVHSLELLFWITFGTNVTYSSCWFLI